MITMIVAYNSNFIIGDGKSIPWKISEDLKLFKSLTMNSVCIMGRKTWESIPSSFKPLPGRINVIVTRNDNYNLGPMTVKENTGIDVQTGIDVHSTIESAIKSYENKEIFIIGGSQIYEYCIKNNLVDRVLASEIKGYFNVEGDVKFVNLKELGWFGTLIKKYEEFDLVEYRKNEC